MTDIARDQTEYLQRTILQALRRRAPEATICPSEVAKMASAEHWREWMDPVRDAAWRLAAAGRVVVLQRGRPVQRSSAVGPIRIMLADTRLRRKLEDRRPPVPVAPRAKRKQDLQRKICATCGRPFAWRRKWADRWEEVRYCSERCRRTRQQPRNAF